MAAVIAKKLHGKNITVESAGIAPAPGPTTPEAVEVMKKIFGVDIGDHRPRHVLDFPLDEFDYIIAMDSAVFMSLTEMTRIPKEKLYGWDVPDPCGLGIEAYERAARQIELYLDQFLLNREIDKGLFRRK